MCNARYMILCDRTVRDFEVITVPIAGRPHGRDYGSTPTSPLWLVKYYPDRHLNHCTGSLHHVGRQAGDPLENHQLLCSPT